MTRKLIGVLLCAGLLAPISTTASASPVIVRFVCFGEATDVWEPNRRGVVRGTNRADVIVVTRRHAVVLGRGGNDRICTSRGANYVFGGRGHDQISLGRGNDRADGGPGRDYIAGGPGADRLNGGYGASDTLVGGSGNDRLVGGGGLGADDFLFGGRGEDLLAADEGDDLLIGGDGGDELDGGSGVDTADFAFEDAAVTVDLSRPGVPLTSGDVLYGIENVRGSTFGDLVTGSSSANAIHGDDGDDSLMGGDGGDLIEGGRGADLLEGGPGIDLASFLDLGGPVHADLAAGTAAANATDSVTGFEDLRGTAYDDELHGDDGPNVLFGSLGANTIFGRAGDDTLHRAAAGDAGDGDDWCFDAAVEACEHHVASAPRRGSIITFPGQGAILTVDDLSSIEGTGGARRVALRRLSGSGCYWWHAKLAHMEAGHCARPHWNDTKRSRDGSWAKRVPSPPQLLNPGRYEVWSRVNTTEFTENTFEIPYNRISFRLQ